MLISGLVAAVALLAARPTKVAVAEVEAGLRADPKLTKLVTDLVTSELRRRPGLQVTSQSDIQALLGFERQKALLGCMETSCLAELGGALGVDQIVTGSLSRAGESLVLLLRAVDVRRAKVLHDVTRRFPTASEDALLDSIPGVAAELFPEAPREVPSGALAPTAEVKESHGRSAAPWWLLGVGLGIAVIGGSLVGYELASKQSTASGGVTTYPISWSQAQSDNTVGYAGQTAIGVGAATAVSGALWALLRPAATGPTP